MVTMTPTAFVGALRSCGLLDTPQLGELSRSEAVRGEDPRPLARQLLHRGWLTPYQINQVLAGHAPELVLGSYVLLERLGEGGMGQVYKARHQKLGRVVALKVIRKDRNTDAEAVSRFRREIEAISRLSHPNIVLAFDADEMDGTLFFVMEHVEGTSLKDQVQRHGPLSVPLACEYVRQAALGLDHIAAHGLVHRDIKPSNLLVTHPPGAPTSGLVKILDLGLARLRMGQAAGGDSGTLTRNGVLMGTPDYIATEQAANPHGADVRADLYSLGCTLYFLLSRSVPFPGGSPVEKLFRHRCDDPQPIEKLRPGLPRDVSAIVRKLMAKKPEDRIQTPVELAEQLLPLAAAADRPSTVRQLPTFPATADVTEFGRALDQMEADAKKSLGVRPDDKTKRRAFRLPRGRRLGWLSGVGIVAVLLVGLMAIRPGAGEAEPSSATSPPISRINVPGERRYVRRPTRNETILATLRANGLPTLEGDWHYIGPFEYWRHDHQSRGFHDAYPPEKEIDLAKTYAGKGNQAVGWKRFSNFKPGEIVDLRLFADNDGSCIYLYHEFEARETVLLPLSLGSDDTLTVWFNGQSLIAKETQRGCSPDQDQAMLAVKPGKNQVLIKVCNINGAWAVYAMPQLPAVLENTFGASLRRDFPGK